MVHKYKCGVESSSTSAKLPGLLPQLCREFGLLGAPLEGTCLHSWGHLPEPNALGWPGSSHAVAGHAPRPALSRAARLRGSPSRRLVRTCPRNAHSRSSGEAEPVLGSSEELHPCLASLRVWLRHPFGPLLCLACPEERGVEVV